LLKYLQEELGVTHLLEMDAALQGTHQVIRIGNVSTAKDWASNSEGVRLWHNGLIPGFTSTLCLDRQPSTAPLGGAFVINNQNDEARDNAFTDLTCGLTLNLVNQR